MSLDNGELSGCGVGVENRGPGQVDGVCLEVLVEIGVSDGADPVVAGLECCSWTGATPGRDGAAGCGGCGERSKCGRRAGFRRCNDRCWGSGARGGGSGAGNALRVVWKSDKRSYLGQPLMLTLARRGISKFEERGCAPCLLVEGTHISADTGCCSFPVQSTA